MSRKNDEEIRQMRDTIYHMAERIGRLEVKKNQEQCLHKSIMVSFSQSEDRVVPELKVRCEVCGKVFNTISIKQMAQFLFTHFRRLDKAYLQRVVCEKSS